MQKYVRKICISSVPENFFAAYECSEFESVEKRFKYHPERQCVQFYDAVADNLRDGRFFPYPAGADHTIYPASHAWTFEKVRFLVLLLNPYDVHRKILICPAEEVPEEQILRASHTYADMYVTEYKRFYSNSIRHSKAKSA